ncbi:AP-3 complex subunit beta-2-like isoform X2 [Diadema setosum]|uniref:AP-3 complex subunit beta-2-like isoform X2 n=1 Tax=Diadema setosum TaxID=31175 RepID=UPI003B3A9084
MFRLKNTLVATKEQEGTGRNMLRSFTAKFGTVHVADMVKKLPEKLVSLPSRVEAAIHKDYEKMSADSSRSYANEKTPSTGSGEADIAADPASGGFFATDYKKHEDLKSMLDGNKDGLKLEAMKRIIGMIAKGKDASDLFAAVVKNVVSKNIEIKKLVYVYLVRYAEEQQDLALLSISTFQKGLKDPNQLIRASALRVLSSIRVHMIVPIMMLAIKESVNDMSPYVRKTAAHAIPKLYNLDPEQKEQLVEVIEKLLADKTTLVAGSVVMAFEEVCPERIDLIHKNFRKLCNLLIDVEEWGQVVIINMLTRYSRTQFLDPNKADVIQEQSERSFYGSEHSEEEDEEKETEQKKPYIMDSDHRLLLRSVKPLLQSRNASVVMAVAQLYHHIAPKNEVGLIAKPLVRLLRSHREVQSVVLSNVATMSANRRGMFEPFLKSFFVRSSDATHIRLLKLEIMTNIASGTSISTILKELQTYVTSSDKEFVAATIQAIGRCASNIEEVTESCMNGLMGLMSNRDEAVVAESVVVIRKLLQMNPTGHKEIIRHMAKLADAITVPMARASILWLIGEYSDNVPKIAPDVLRKMAKGFIGEEDIVKLQILNLAAKLYLTNSKQTKLLLQYVLNLAKYDQNYDIRDRARFLKHLLLPGDKSSTFSKHAKKIILSTKPAPVIESVFKDRDQFQLGSLSHMINAKATGYIELPDFPEVAPDPSVRVVEEALPWTGDRKEVAKKKMKAKSFYSSSEESEEEEDEEGSSSEEGSEMSSGSASSSGSGSESEESSDEESEEEDSSEARSSASDSGKSASASESEEDSSEESESESEEDVKPVKKKTPQKSKPKEEKKGKQKPESTMQLLDFDDFGPSAESSQPTTPAGPTSILTPTLATDLQGLSLSDKPLAGGTMFASKETFELLNRVNSGGLSATYRFPRTTCIYSTTMVAVEVSFSNNSSAKIQNISIGETKLAAGMKLHEFPPITNLSVGQSTTAILGVDFRDTTQPANFEICTESRKFSVTVKAPIGELLQPTTMSEREFLSQQSKLTGMNEHSDKGDIGAAHREEKALIRCVGEIANVQIVPASDPSKLIYRFAAKTISAGTPVLLTVQVLSEGKARITVNCEKMVIGNMLVKDVKKAFSKA